MPRNTAARYRRRYYPRVIRPRGRSLTESDFPLQSDFGTWADTVAIEAPGIALSSTFSTWADTVVIDANVELTDTWLFADDVTIGGNIAISLSTSAAWADSLALAGGIALTDSWTLTDSVSLVAPTVALTDTWAWTDSVGVGGAITIALTDDWGWVDTISITDSTGLSATIDCYVINAIIGATSQYTWQFDSYMQIGSTTYAVDSAGLYTLGGATDDGTNIDAEVRTGMMDFGTPKLKRTDKLVIGGTSEYELIAKVITHEDTELTTYEYDTHRLADTPSELHVKAGKGMKSRYFQYGFCNQTGADFEIDRLDIFALALSRHR